MELKDIAKDMVFVAVSNLEYPAWPRSNASSKTLAKFHEGVGVAIQAREETIRPGAILRLKSGELRLVGHVNANLGVCDDCVEFQYEDISEVAYLY